jgi:hypothetical protein
MCAVGRSRSHTNAADPDVPRSASGGGFWAGFVGGLAEAVDHVGDVDRDAVHHDLADQGEQSDEVGFADPAEDRVVPQTCSRIGTSRLPLSRWVMKNAPPPSVASAICPGQG